MINKKNFFQQLAEATKPSMLERAMMQPVQKTPKPARINRLEAIEKMQKILDCIHQANMRINSTEQTRATWTRLGFFFDDQFAGLDRQIEATEAAKKKLKKYFNKIAKSIELFA